MRLGGCGGGFGGAVVISVTVKTGAVIMEDLSKRKNAQNGEQGTKHGDLGDTMGDWGIGGEGGAGYAEGVLKAREEDGMVDFIKGGAKDEDG